LFAGRTQHLRPGDQCRREYRIPLIGTARCHVNRHPHLGDADEFVPPLRSCLARPVHVPDLRHRDGSARENRRARDTLRTAGIERSGLPGCCPI
jgi:hypothetical protein